MLTAMPDVPLVLVAVLALALVVGAVGVGLGIFVLAPGIRRALDRAEQADEDDRDRSD
jgi:hypothetical protein